jgi:hypothetical protein
MFTSIFLIAVIGAVGALLAIVCACRVSGRLPQITLFALAAVLLVPALYLVQALHPEIIDRRFRTYKAFYRDIRVGMTKSEVLAVLDRRYPKLGPRHRPTVMEDKPERLGFFMNPEGSKDPNCEGVFLTLQEGRVTGKHYSPD